MVVVFSVVNYFVFITTAVPLLVVTISVIFFVVVVDIIVLIFNISVVYIPTVAFTATNIVSIVYPQLLR